MTVTTTAGAVQKRLLDVARRVTEAAVAADRDPDSVSIVGVSKTVEWPAIQAAYDVGLRLFGENRIQDARARIPAAHPEDLKLHFIGQLQTNKVGQMLDLFDYVESVDRSSLIAELQKQVAKRDIFFPVLLQVNVAGEEQKAGCGPETALALAREIEASPNLDLRGLMTIAPLVETMEDVRPVFASLRTLRDEIATELGRALPELSMGMSNDFPVAIAEGATLVRIGRAIFAG